LVSLIKEVFLISIVTYEYLICFLKLTFYLNLFDIYDVFSLTEAILKKKFTVQLHF